MFMIPFNFFFIWGKARANKVSASLHYGQVFIFSECWDGQTIFTMDFDPQPEATRPGKPTSTYHICQESRVCYMLDSWEVRLLFPVTMQEINTTSSSSPSPPPPPSLQQSASMYRIWLTTDSFPSYYLHRTKKSSQRKPNIHCNQSYRMPHF